MTTPKLESLKHSWHDAVAAEQRAYDAACESRDFAAWRQAGHETDKRWFAFKAAFRRLHMRNPTGTDRV